MSGREEYKTMAPLGQGSINILISTPFEQTVTSDGTYAGYILVCSLQLLKMVACSRFN